MGKTISYEDTIIIPPHDVKSADPGLQIKNHKDIVYHRDICCTMINIGSFELINYAVEDKNYETTW